MHELSYSSRTARLLEVLNAASPTPTGRRRQGTCQESLITKCHWFNVDNLFNTIFTNLADHTTLQRTHPHTSAWLHPCETWLGRNYHPFLLPLAFVLYFINYLQLSDLRHASPSLGLCPISWMKKGKRYQDLLSTFEITYTVSNHEVKVKGEGEGYIVFSRPWPGIMRTVYGDQDR